MLSTHQLRHCTHIDALIAIAPSCASTHSHSEQMIDCLRQTIHSTP